MLWRTGSNNAENTTLNGNVGVSDTSITLTSTTGLQAPGIITVDRVNSAGTPTPAVREYIGFTGISTNTLTGCTRGLGGSTAQTHSSGATVEETFDTTKWNDLITAMLNAFTSAGALDTTKVVDLTTAQSVTNKTLGTGTKVSLGSDAQGDIYYNAGSGVLSRLAAGTSGQFLQTQGASANPQWASGASTDGWTTDPNSLTYVSANSFKITGTNVTTQYSKGARIKFTNNSTTFYGVVASSSFSTDTTVTLIANNDYSINNSAITAPFYSYQANPQGYPGWFNYTPTFVGFSSSPTGANMARFSVMGNTCFIMKTSVTSGTSNANTFTMTAPVATPVSASVSALTLVRAIDNGSSVASVSAYLSNNSNIITFEKTLGAPTSWTTSGNKDIYLTFSYEF